MEEIGLTVEGWPPKKSEAKSLLSAEHSDRDCVAKLLRSVLHSVVDSPWNPTESRPVGLELVVRARSLNRTPGNATNYLGGVADVLQADKL